MSIIDVLVILIGSLFAQQRFTGNIKITSSFAAACFASLLFSLILEQTTGILSGVIFFIQIGITILSVLWLFLESEE